MMQTIKASRYVYIQGEVVRRSEDGQVTIRVGNVEYVGRPLAEPAAPADPAPAA